MHRLPSLASLRAFEAAARHTSFTRAAEELHVTPTAVSHQIRGLEEWLGTRLFERSTRSVRLTETGAGYYPAVQSAFDGLAAATERARRSCDDGVLTVTTTTSFLTKWLIPRLADFQARYPEIDLRISTSPDSLDLAASSIDCALRYGGGTWHGLVADRLIEEQVVPVCSPGYLDGRPPLETPADLAHHSLLHITSQPDDWRLWLTAAGAPGVDPTRGLRFDMWVSSLQAAIDGLGIALGHSPLVRADLEQGRLVRALDLELPGEFAYYLVYPRGAPLRAPLEAFRDWLCEKASE